MDDVLPLPNPDWDNPEPCDAPTLEEQDALKAIYKLRNMLDVWLPLAATMSLPPAQWRDMVAALNTVTLTVAAADTDPVATHVLARIEVHPHPVVTLDGRCARCHLPIDNPIHQTDAR